MYIFHGFQTYRIYPILIKCDISYIVDDAMLFYRCFEMEVVILVSSTTDTRFAAVYLRVSTEDQVELSPESQMEEIRKYAKREGIIILEDQIYSDPGISGKKAEKRPQFMKMIATAKEKNCPFSIILLWKFSRFARNQEESIFYKSILRSKCGIEVISVTEPLAAGPFGSLIERIIEWMDEFYSIRLAQEVKRSMTVNAQKGKLQSTPSFGYKVENRQLVVKDDEAEYVRRIFDSFVSGKGIYPIARELNDLGVRTHRGNMFENRTVEYILRNPVYIGKLRWNPSGRTRRDFFNENIIVADSTHEPIITQDTWDAAQRRLDEIKSQWGYKARPTYELKGWVSGIVRCASCGATLIFSKPHFYKCNNYARGRCKHSQHVKASDLEDAIISRMRKDAACVSDLRFDVIYTNSSSGRELIRLQASLKVIAGKKERLQEAYLAGVIELGDFSAAKSKMESDAERIASSIRDLQEQTNEEASREALQNAINKALATLESPSSSLAEKNAAARSVIENCVFDKEASTLEITYRVIL